LGSYKCVKVLASLDTNSSVTKVLKKCVSTADYDCDYGYDVEMIECEMYVVGARMVGEIIYFKAEGEEVPRDGSQTCTRGVGGGDTKRGLISQLDDVLCDRPR
jgi:hypothetical protein